MQFFLTNSRAAETVVGNPRPTLRTTAKETTEQGPRVVKRSKVGFIWRVTNNAYLEICYSHF